MERSVAEDETPLRVVLSEWE